MGVYGDRILPWAIDKMCGTAENHGYRAAICAGSPGSGLELLPLLGGVGLDRHGVHDVVVEAAAQRGVHHAVLLQPALAPERVRDDDRLEVPPVAAHRRFATLELGLVQRGLGLLAIVRHSEKLLSAYGHSSEHDMAKQTLDQLNQKFRRERQTEFTLDSPKNRWPFRIRQDRERLIEGLRRAGVPEW